LNQEREIVQTDEDRFGAATLYLVMARYGGVSLFRFLKSNYEVYNSFDTESSYHQNVHIMALIATGSIELYFSLCSYKVSKGKSSNSNEVY